MLITGHRGAKGEAPENTLSGFRHLKSLGVKAVELDVQITADHALVVFHDHFLQEKSTGTGFIANHTLASLKQLHIKHYGKKLNDKIPTLDEVLEVIKDFEHIQLEVKAFYPNKLSLKQLAQQLANIYTKHSHQVIVTCFNVSFLKYMQQNHPQVTTGLLLEEYCFGNPDYDDEDYDAEVFWPSNKAVALAKELECQWIIPKDSILDQYTDFVEIAHQQNLKVSTWTVNDNYDMTKYQKMGVDSLITDYPSLALKTLAQDGFSSSTNPIN